MNVTFVCVQKNILFNWNLSASIWRCRIKRFSFSVKLSDVFQPKFYLLIKYVWHHTSEQLILGNNKIYVIMLEFSPALLFVCSLSSLRWLLKFFLRLLVSFPCDKVNLSWLANMWYGFRSGFSCRTNFAAEFISSDVVAMDVEYMFSLSSNRICIVLLLNLWPIAKK